MKKQLLFATLIFCFLFSLGEIFAQDTAKSHPPKKWYETISLRGYTQLRYNRLLETNSDLKCEQCDKSWGDNGGFFLRRARLVFSGNLTDKISFYFQPDFASSSGTSLNFGQIRDAYFDIAFDDEREFRIRLGQSKIPFGFENLQSSQNRLPLDRDDALNSAFANERDLGGFFYWAPASIRKRFSALVSTGLKGSGDYGVAGFGVFNGQTANRNEMNNSLHMVGRLSYPFQIGDQIFEPGVQAYAGRIMIADTSRGVGNSRNEFRDERWAASFIWYPQPYGIQAEYNQGTGPEFDGATKSILQKPLQGGYLMAMYKTEIFGQTIIPFVRTQYYIGGKKQELDARSYTVRENEIGIEWQPVSAFELVAMYTMSDRRFEDMAKPVNHQKGNLLRLQAQINY